VQYSPNGRSDIFYNVLQHHQTLIAAISGHGKSFLLNTILSDLYNTPPSLLKIDVLDFKNDLKVNTNRVSNFILSDSEIEDYLLFLESEKERRRFVTSESRRLVVIDEAAEIPKEYDEKIASIMKLGRSIGINTILATQHPTANQLGKMIARSFTHRIVGRVENATAAKWATGTEGSGAESLLRPGSFLFCHGSDVKRFQVFTND
jgi:DNA segregation ATPase FtsK/SpoIIIE-like protein